MDILLTGAHGQVGGALIVIIVVLYRRVEIDRVCKTLTRLSIDVLLKIVTIISMKEHLATRAGYDFTYLDRRAEPDDDTGPTGLDTHVADIADCEAIRPAFDSVDAVVHLAAYPTTDGTWEQVHRNNLVGTQNVLRAVSEADVSDVVFASSIHAVGMYEEEAAPAVYERDHALIVIIVSHYRWVARTGRRPTGKQSQETL
jgi:UDP-glucose 4-epimerase